MVDVGWNFGRKEKCPICMEADDTQSHLLYCDELNGPNMTHCTSDVDLYDLNTHMKQVENAVRRREVILGDREG